ncbi:hypothetical protein BJ742DRAFT_780086 [Cladochytrium replicatum]|nr:hypothetical protein BJ742DRAFT_780086 [Cladochytrium replicatum]
MSTLPPIKVGSTDVTTASGTAAPNIAAIPEKNGKLLDASRNNTTIAASSYLNVLKDAAIYRAERELNLQSFREHLRIFQNASTSKLCVGFSNRTIALVDLAAKTATWYDGAFEGQTLSLRISPWEATSLSLVTTSLR